MKTQKTVTNTNEGGRPLFLSFYEFEHTHGAYITLEIRSDLSHRIRHSSEYSASTGFEWTKWHVFIIEKEKNVCLVPKPAWTERKLSFVISCKNSETARICSRGGNSNNSKDMCCCEPSRFALSIH